MKGEMGMLENENRNQHFLTAVEQKLNALNQKAVTKKFKIYSFTVLDRDRCSLALENPNGRSINNNLSMLDLFSFDVAGGGRLRMNFEDLFQKYEETIEANTRSLLAKLNSRNGDIRVEIIDLFAAKFLNFIRNPFSVTKVLNTFPKVGTYEPTDPNLLAIYRRIVSGKKPHQAHLCSQMNISDQQYVSWLRTLFMLLVQTGDDRLNLFEETIKNLLENKKHHILVSVYIFDEHCCLLSDRGYCRLVPDGKDVMAFSFNLCANAFINYAFVDVGLLMRDNLSPGLLAAFEGRPEVEINVTPFWNDVAMLARYNRRVIEQCHQRVYCSAKDGLVLPELGSAAGV